MEFSAIVPQQNLPPGKRKCTKAQKGAILHELARLRRHHLSGAPGKKRALLVRRPVITSSEETPATTIVCTCPEYHEKHVLPSKPDVEKVLLVAPPNTKTKFQLQMFENLDEKDFDFAETIVNDALKKFPSLYRSHIFHEKRIVTYFNTKITMNTKEKPEIVESDTRVTRRARRRKSLCLNGQDHNVLRMQVNIYRARIAHMKEINEGWWQKATNMDAINNKNKHQAPAPVVVSTCFEALGNIIKLVEPSVRNIIALLLKGLKSSIYKDECDASSTYYLKLQECTRDLEERTREKNIWEDRNTVITERLEALKTVLSNARLEELAWHDGVDTLKADVQDVEAHKFSLNMEHTAQIEKAMQLKLDLEQLRESAANLESEVKVHQELEMSMLENLNKLTLQYKAFKSGNTLSSSRAGPRVPITQLYRAENLLETSKEKLNRYEILQRSLSTSIASKLKRLEQTRIRTHEIEEKCKKLIENHEYELLEKSRALTPRPDWQDILNNQLPCTRDNLCNYSNFGKEIMQILSDHKNVNTSNANRDGSLKLTSSLVAELLKLVEAFPDQELSDTERVADSQGFLNNLQLIRQLKDEINVAENKLNKLKSYKASALKPPEMENDLKFYDLNQNSDDVAPDAPRLNFSSAVTTVSSRAQKVVQVGKQRSKSLRKMRAPNSRQFRSLKMGPRSAIETGQKQNTNIQRNRNWSLFKDTKKTIWSSSENSTGNFSKKSFYGLGIEADVPRFLRFCGPVRNRDIGIVEFDGILNDILETLEKEPELPSLSECAYKTLKKKFGIQAIIAEWGYNILDTLTRFEHENALYKACKMCLDEVLHKDFFKHQRNMVKGLHAYLSLVDEQQETLKLKALERKKTVTNTGSPLSLKISLFDFKTVLANFFPQKNMQQLEEIMDSLDEESKKGIVRYNRLFGADDMTYTGSSRNGKVPPSLFLNTICRQMVEEEETYLKQIVSNVQETLKIMYNEKEGEHSEEAIRNLTTMSIRDAIKRSLPELSRESILLGIAFATFTEEQNVNWFQKISDPNEFLQRFVQSQFFIPPKGFYNSTIGKQEVENSLGLSKLAALHKHKKFVRNKNAKPGDIKTVINRLLSEKIALEHNTQEETTKVKDETDRGSANEINRKKTESKIYIRNGRKYTKLGNGTNRKFETKIKRPKKT